MIFAFCKQSDSGNTPDSIRLAAPDSGQVQANIAPVYGGFVSLGSEASLAVPADAIEKNEQISIQKVAKPGSVNGITPVQAGYKFGPEGLNFQKPAQVTFCYDAKELQGLDERTMQVYYLTEDGDYASMGGTVDPVSHCVSAQVEHFSTYIPAAYQSQSGNQAPVISAPIYLPQNPVIGVPLRVRVLVSDWEGINNNGFGGGISNVRLFYRKSATGAYSQVTMMPDYEDTTAQRYFAVIPPADVTAAGIWYYVEARDNLNTLGTFRSASSPLRLRVTRSIDATNPLRIVAQSGGVALTSPLNMAAGFSRDLNFQIKLAGSATYYPVIPENIVLSSPFGTVIRSGASQYRLQATTRTQAIPNTLIFSVAGYSTSLPVNVQTGYLTRIDLLTDTGISINGNLTVRAGETFIFDAAGFDAFGNKTEILPVFSTNGAIGSITQGGSTSGATFTAGSSYPVNGAVRIDFQGFSDTVPVNIATPNFTVGGLVSGLNSGTIVLTNNAINTVTLRSNGPFMFSQDLLAGDTYNVSITQQPNGMQCLINHGSGTVTSSNITNIEVICTNTPPTAAISPPTLSELSDDSAIVLEFNKSMQPGSFVISGSLAGEMAVPAWSTNAYVNNVLTLKPTGLLSPGSAKTLLISGLDADGASYSISLSYAVRSVYYVHPNGNYQNDGSRNAPKQAVDDAFYLAYQNRPAEVKVAQGEYNSLMSYGGPVTIRGGFSPVDWAAQNPLFFPTNFSAISHNSGPGKLTLDGINLTNRQGSLSARQPIEITNSDLTQVTIGGVSGYQEVTIRNCRFNFTIGAILNVSEFQGGGRVLVENNLINAGNTYGIPAATLTPVNGQGSTEVIFRNNLVVTSGPGNGIELDANDIVVANNTIVSIGSQGIGVSISPYNTPNLNYRMENNITSGFSTSFDAPVNGALIRQNNFFGAQSVYRNSPDIVQIQALFASPNVTGNTIVNPQFVNVSMSDYRLAIGSPMRSGGRDLSTDFFTDLQGTKRTIPWSLGAYEGD